MKKFLLQILLLLFFSNIYSQDEVNFIQRRSYTKIVMSLDDLNKIIGAVNYYVRTDSSSSIKEVTLPRNETLTLSDKSRNLTYKKFYTISEGTIGKSNFNEVRLDYKGFNKDISIIEIRLDQYERILYISGSDQIKVEALFQVLDKTLEKCTTMIDWNSFLLPISLILLCLSGSFLFASSSLPNKDLNWVVAIIVVSAILTFLVYFIVYITSGDHVLFPRFILTNETSRWIDRNANDMEFVGFLAIIISLVSWLIKIYPKTKTHSTF